MADANRMTLCERLKYLRLIQPRYRQATHRSRSYDQPRPPFERLCATAAIPTQRQATLADLRQATNPLALRDEVHSLLDRLSRLPAARPGKPQDVRQTLFEAASCLPATAASVTLSIE